MLPGFAGAAREEAPTLPFPIPEAGGAGILARSRRVVCTDGGVLAGDSDGVGGATGAGGAAGFAVGFAGFETSVIFEPNVSPGEGFEILRIQLFS